MDVQSPVRAAFDIETVSPQLDPDEQPNFDDSRHFELLGAAVAYEYPDGSRETTVRWRDGRGPAAELGVVDWIVDSLTDAGTVLTYNGTEFDTVHLVGRARIAGAAAGERRPFERAERLVDEMDHLDLKSPAWAAFGDFTSLEESLEAIGVEPAATDPAAFDHGLPASAWATDPESPVASKDVARLGEWYLDLVDEESEGSDADTDDLRAMLDHYARADVEDLFALADARPFEAG